MEKEIISYLERMEDRIMDYKLSINLFKEYCNFLQKLYNEKISIDYLKYAYLLDNANVLEPKYQNEWLTYQYYKGNIKELINTLENKKSK